MKQFLKPLPLELMMAQLPGNVFCQDKEGNIIWCSDQQARCIGFNNNEEIIGKNIAELVRDKKNLEEIEQNNNLVLSKDKPFVLKEEPVFLDGKQCTFYSQKAPLRNSDGEIIGVIGMAIDITELKEAEQEKLQGMTAASSTIAHELRTPLASISSAINGLKKYFPALLDCYLTAKKSALDIQEIPPPHFESLLTLLDDIQSELYSANTIINMLLQNIKQPELQTEQLAPCLISQCIEDAISRYPFSSDKQAQLIHLEFEHDFSFMGNHLLMVHILFNLIKNALYAIEAAGKGDIHLWLENSDKENFLYIRDTGKGISQSILPRLFDKFFTTSSHGTGLGLSFCKRAMQSFGGDITCESVEGEFTLFKLTFPVI